MRCIPALTGLFFGSLLLSTALQAQSTGRQPGGGTRRNPYIPQHLMMGELMEKQGSEWVVRPWDLKKPSRERVRIAPEARFFQAREGNRKDLQVGDFVLAVFVKPPKPPAAPAATGEASPAKGDKATVSDAKPPKPLTYYAVLRLPLLGSQPVRADRRAARVILAADLTFFRPEQRQTHRPPGKESRLSIGVITSLSPFTLETQGGKVSQELDRNALVINHRAVDPAEMRRGANLTLSTPPAGAEEELTDPTDEDAGGERQPEPVPQADERESSRTPTAVLVVQSPVPRMSPGETRRFILREHREKKSGSGPSQ